MWSRRRYDSASPDFERSAYLRRLFAAGSRASALGIGLLDSQTRFLTVNNSLAQETQASIDRHIGRTSREVVGDLARQIEPAYENVLRTGESESVLLAGHVRASTEFGYWLDHCFPIFDNSGRVRQLGLFVVNVTAEQASAEILDALANDPKRLVADAAKLLHKFDEAVRCYHRDLRLSFEELALASADPARNTAVFRSSVQELDEQIREMRELIYTLISQFPIPAC